MTSTRSLIRRIFKRAAEALAPEVFDAPPMPKAQKKVRPAPQPQPTSLAVPSQPSAPPVAPRVPNTRIQGPATESLIKEIVSRIQEEFAKPDMQNPADRQYFVEGLVKEYGPDKEWAVDEALNRLQKLEAQPTLLPDQNIFPDLSDQDMLKYVPIIEEIIKQTGAIPSFTSLGDYPEIVNNERNRDKFFTLADHLFRNQQEAAAQNAVPQQSEPSFTQPLSQVFYESYLGSGAMNAEENYSKLAGNEVIQGASLDRLDEVFKPIPNGRDGRRYDTVIGFFLDSDFYNPSGGTQYLEQYRNELEGMRKTDQAAYLAQNHHEELASMFESLMMEQDPNVFEYIRRKLVPKSDAANRGGVSLVDSQTGGQAEVAEDRNYANLSGRETGRVRSDEEKGLLWDAFKGIPESVAAVAPRIEQLLREKKQNEFDRKKRKTLNKYMPASIALANVFQESFSSFYDALRSGKVMNEKIYEKLMQNGITPVKAPDGLSVKFKFDPTADPSKVMDSFDLKDFIPPKKLLGSILQYMDNYIAQSSDTDYRGRSPQDITNEILGTEAKRANPAKGTPEQSAQPLNRDVLFGELSQNPEIRKSQQDYIKKAEQRVFQLSQFMLSYIGKDLINWLRTGQIEPQVARGLISLYRPHADSQRWGRYLSRHSPQERKLLRNKPVESEEPDISGDEEEGAKKRVSKPYGRRKLLEDVLGPEPVSQMDDNAVYDEFLKRAPDLLNQEAFSRDSRREMADYIAQLMDFGKEHPWTGDKRMFPKNAFVSGIYAYALLKIAELMELKNGLAKYASVSHIYQMMDSISIDAEERVAEVWTNQNNQR